MRPLAFGEVEENKKWGTVKMSMIVARMQKMKSENLVGIGNHNQRKTSKHSNPDIDVERSYLNYDLVNRTDNYKTDIERYINDHKVSKRAVRADAVLVNEWIITSDTAFFSPLNDTEKRRFFQSAMNFFAERYGDDNIRYATVHLDERTPHMHLGIVPFTEDYKLSAKTVFDRKSLQSIQDELPVYLREKGFDIVRGKENSKAKHLTTPEFKEKVRQLEHLDKAIKQNQSRLYQQIELEDTVKTLLHDPISEVPPTPYRNAPLNKVIVDKDDFQRLKSAAHRFKDLCRQQRGQLLNQTQKIEFLEGEIHVMKREEQRKDEERQANFDYKKSLLEREFRDKNIKLEDKKIDLIQREKVIDERIHLVIEWEERAEALLNNPEYDDREKMDEMAQQIQVLNIKNQALTQDKEKLTMNNKQLQEKIQSLGERNQWLEERFERAKKAILTAIKAINLLVIGKEEYRLNLNLVQSRLLKGVHQFVSNWLQEVGDTEKSKIARITTGIEPDIQRESGLYPRKEDRKRERGFEMER